MTNFGEPPPWIRGSSQRWLPVTVPERGRAPEYLVEVIMALMSDISRKARETKENTRTIGLHSLVTGRSRSAKHKKT
jgi:hypothetical protein